MSKTKSNCKVGIDLGNRSYVACRLSPQGDEEYLEGRLSEKGYRALKKWLKPDDAIFIESGSVSFVFARRIQRITECTVSVLEARQLQIIYRSVKKTDKNDAYRLASMGFLGSRFDLPIVRQPGIFTERLRQLFSERMKIVRQLTQIKNQIYAYCISNGITSIRRRDYASLQNLDELIQEVPDSMRSRLLRLRKSFAVHEELLEEVEAEMDALVQENEELQVMITLYTSVPGIGKITAFAIAAYMGDFRDFSNRGAVSSFIGLVPRVDHSCTIRRTGHISKTGNRQLRSLLVMAAWSHVRTKKDSPIKAFYLRLRESKGKKKAIVATARKIMETVYAMSKTGEFYQAA